MNDNEQLLEGLKKVLKIAKANGNQLFIENIERDIEALEAGKESPIIKKYLTAEERSKKTIQTKKIRRANFQQDP
jgi:hypothetical protein